MATHIFFVLIKLAKNDLLDVSGAAFGTKY
jgi:hypothetical protein